MCHRFIVNTCYLSLISRGCERSKSEKDVHDSISDNRIPRYITSEKHQNVKK